MIELQKLLNSAEDIVVLEKHPAENIYRFAVPFMGDFARECYDKTLAIDNKLPDFHQHYWKFNTQTQEINGSSDNHLARLSRVLRSQGLELPDTIDLLELQRQRKLKTGNYYDSGIVVYNDDSPNKETAIALIGRARQEGRGLPLLWGFGDLDYKVEDSQVKIIPFEEPRRVVSGEKAEQTLKRFCLGSRSGAQGVCRGGGGSWDASWGGFAVSGSDGLVAWLCAKGTRENLTEGYNNLFTRKYDAKKEELTRQIIQLDTERKATEKAVLESLKA